MLSVGTMGELQALGLPRGEPLWQGHLFPALPAPLLLSGEPYSMVGALLSTRFSHPAVVLVPSP